MSNSKFEYVKDYEIHTSLLKGTFIVVRVDGKAFTKFCDKHHLVKPNDVRCVQLMNTAALHVCDAFTEIILAYGQSDEYSFAFKQNAKVYQRREQKIISVLVSTFTSAFVFNWSKFFDVPLAYPVSFDSRVVLYPDLNTLKDYFFWRQVDCHINNLYNTTFWLLVQKEKLSNDEAHKKLKGTFSKDKHEILYNLGFNYNNAESVYKKGSLIIRFKDESKKSSSKNKKKQDYKDNKDNTDIEVIEKNLEKIDINTENIENKKSNDKISLYKTYDCTLDKDLKGVENKEFGKVAENFFSSGLKVVNEDIINNKALWESLLYK